MIFRHVKQGYIVVKVDEVAISEACSHRHKGQIRGKWPGVGQDTSLYID